MLELIGGVVVVYLVIAVLVRLITGERIRRETFIVHEHEIKEDIDEYVEPGAGETVQPGRELPKNVVRFRR